MASLASARSVLHWAAVPDHQSSCSEGLFASPPPVLSSSSTAQPSIRARLATPVAVAICGTCASITSFRSRRCSATKRVGKRAKTLCSALGGTSASVAYDEIFQVASDRVHKELTSESEGIWNGSYDFVQLADPQLGMLHWDREWSEELSLLRQAVQHVNKLKPRFLLISGDLTNAFPSGPNSDPEAAGREVASFKEVLRDLCPSIPLVLQPGNHDVGQIPGPEDVARYRERFGDDYFSFWAGGVLYININSQYYVDSTRAQSLREAQDRWLMSVLESEEVARAKHVVFLSHVPPCIASEDEPPGWSNWELEPRRKILAAAASAGCKLWFCGHYHGNVVFRTGAGIEIVVTGSCGSAINWILPASEVATQPRPDFGTSVGEPAVIADEAHGGLRIVRVREDGITHRWFTLDNVPKTFDEVFGRQDGSAERVDSIIGRPMNDIMA